MRTANIKAAIEKLNAIEPQDITDGELIDLMQLAQTAQLTFSAAMFGVISKTCDARINLAEQRKAEEAAH